MFDKKPEPKEEPKAEGARAVIEKHAAALDEVLETPKKPEPKKPKAKKEEKEEKPQAPRRNRVTVLRDLVEDLESDPNLTEEQRQPFMELNRRLTRALAR